jgi:hypothetical protein
MAVNEAPGDARDSGAMEEENLNRSVSEDSLVIED